MARTDTSLEQKHQSEIINNTKYNITHVLKSPCNVERVPLITSTFNGPRWNSFSIGKDPCNRLRRTILVEFFGPHLSTVKPVLKGPGICFFLGTNQWIRPHRAKECEWLSSVHPLRLSCDVAKQQIHHLNKVKYISKLSSSLLGRYLGARRRPTSHPQSVFEIIVIIQMAKVITKSNVLTSSSFFLLSSRSYHFF